MVQQAGLNGALLSGYYAPYSKVATFECVVIAVRFIDDARNLSKTYVEYDVRDLRTSQIYNNCVRCDQVAGMDDGEENILRPAQKQIGASTPVFDPKTAQLSQSDGDRVLVTCSYGSQHNAVIVAVLPHKRMAYGTNRSGGFRRFQTHRGTSIETQKDGTYQIKRGDTTITLQSNEEIDIVHKSGSSIHLRNDGDVVVIPDRYLMLGGDGLNPLTDGVVNGMSIDPFTGKTQWQLGNASTVVLVKKI